MDSRYRLISPPRWRFYRRLVFKRIRAIFGSRLRYLISGGAPLPVEINRFLAAAEIPIVEGYGLTEAAPVVLVNLHGQTRIGTVGRRSRMSRSKRRRTANCWCMEPT